MYFFTYKLNEKPGFYQAFLIRDKLIAKFTALKDKNGFLAV